MDSEILDAELRLQAAMIASDVAALDALLDERLLFVTPDGAVYGKADDLAVHRAGTQRFTRLEVVDRRIERHEGVAIAVVHTRIAGEFMGTPFDGPFRYMRTWMYGEGGWRVVAGSVCAVLVEPARG